MPENKFSLFNLFDHIYTSLIEDGTSCVVFTTEHVN